MPQSGATPYPRKKCHWLFRYNFYDCKPIFVIFCRAYTTLQENAKVLWCKNFLARVRFVSNKTQKQHISRNICTAHAYIDQIYGKQYR